MSEAILKVIRVHDGSEFEASDFPTLRDGRKAKAELDDMRRDLNRFRVTLEVIAAGKWPVGMSPREYAEAALDDA